jgi:oxygen-independent coproporphyrinogen-3 oxidase
MYGIPGQTMGSWKKTLDQALKLHPEHVSLYSLTIEEGTPFFSMRERGLLTVPDDDLAADMYEEAIRVMQSAGLEHYEISNFAKPGRECRHNITYWRNEPYFGFGAGAASYIDGVRAVRTRDVQTYTSRVMAGVSPIECDEHLEGRGTMGETIFLGLRMLQGIAEQSFAVRYGLLPRQAFSDEIARLEDRRLIECSQGFIHLTPRGLLLANDVFAEFVE